MTQRVFAWFACACLALLAARPVPAQSPALPYRLGPGDQLRVTVFGSPELSGQYTVDGEGRIMLPLIQSVRAAGLTPAELAVVIAERYSPNYLVNAQVSVDIVEYRPYFILGEVNKPGGYAYRQGMTALVAVARAGGFTERANTRKVIVIRAHDPQRKKRRLSVHVPVYPGDIVTVPERFF